ncbi:MAG: RagB/SusD family nutrient uptake outer membrane protein, partial [Bacteroidetes bacterium]|nr:RagB/SusD family nutrient uptake outer membrane protein [Bacteroidota bacterium]
MKTSNKMAKYGMIIMLAIAAFSGLSCHKFLDATPKDVVLEKNFPKDYWDAEFMLRGAYQAMQPLVEYKFVLGEVPGDWVQPGTGADSDIVQLAYHRVSPSNRYTDWQAFYDCINRANYVIKNVPKVPLDPNYFSATLRDQYLGEARFLRCWAYFHLVENFGPVPFVWDAVDDISKVDTLFNIRPSSENLVLDSLEADLVRAYKTTDIQIWVPNSFDAGLRVSVEQSNLRVRKQAVCGLQAEIYLWRNKYSLAATACQNFYNTGIDINAFNGNSGWMGIFSLGPTALYNEPIFRINFSFASREMNSLMSLTTNDAASGGMYMVAPSLAAIKTYNPYYPDSITTNNLKDELYRGFGNSYAGSAPFYNRLKSGAPVIWKFIGLGTVTPATVDVPANVRAPYQSDYVPHVVRQGDLYLLWAEALNRLGDKATAIARLNTIRGRAGMPSAGTASPVYDSITVNSSTQKIENFILRERGLELGFEGRRWYDLMRFARHQGTPASPDASVVIN